MCTCTHVHYYNEHVYMLLHDIITTTEQLHVQWNLSIVDTIGTAQSVLIKEMSSVCIGMLLLGL